MAFVRVVLLASIVAVGCGGEASSSTGSGSSTGGAGSSSSGAAGSSTGTGSFEGGETSSSSSSGGSSSDDGSTTSGTSTSGTSTTGDDALEGRCFDALEQLTAATLPQDLRLDSISEVHCQGGSACYEHIAIYAEGTVVYQNILLEGGSLACVVLDAMAPEDVAELDALVVGFFDAQPPVGPIEPCEPDDPASDDFGVDQIRGRNGGGVLLPVIAFCNGPSGAQPLKILFDAYWAEAPREID